ncbi:hypothetical protein OCL06_15820 [Alteromonas sp. ASW11-19]|uniref:AraC family transcriptional regulator n=1 Tax=Alteromonas salexigens TaxID=2982530 RepID=A0ABT2VSM0_9ALTE|nr:hypothetical protein [Alteromonas salexigens]MCU7556059.1 hypothetical protein [Alteromonas salexigens]
MKMWLASALLAVGLCVTPVTLAQSDQADAASLEADIEDLKQALISLNRDLFILEQDLLFPSSTQVAVYLSVETGEYFSLDAVELKIDDEEVTHYLYTEKQVDALHRGGIQRLFIGNVSQGEHELTAFFVGYGPEGRAYKRAVTTTFEKTGKPVALELTISDEKSKQQPAFTATVL